MLKVMRKKITAIVLTVGFLAAVCVVPGCDQQQPGEAPGMGEEGGGEEQPVQPMQPEGGDQGGDAE